MICEHCGKTINVVKEQDIKDYIIKEILKYFDTDLEKLTTKNNKREVVYNRHVIMYFLRKKTKMTLREIGLLFNRDHTSSIHAVKHINDLIFSDPEVRNDIEQINNLL